MSEADRILELIRKKGWTKYKLAQESGLYSSTVYSWFRTPAIAPSKSSLECICRAFGITLTEFYGGVDFDEVRSEQTLLLELFEQLTPKKKKMIFDLMRSLIEDKEEK